MPEMKRWQLWLEWALTLGIPGSSTEVLVFMKEKMDWHQRILRKEGAQSNLYLLVISGNVSEDKLVDRLRVR